MSEQLAIDFISAPAYRQLARREFVLRRLVELGDRFKYVSVDWLQKNWALWEAFEHEANRVWNAGRRHFGARRIGEHIRYETALREHGEPLKANDHIWPDFSRLYVALHPDRKDIFELRGRAS